MNMTLKSLAGSVAAAVVSASVFAAPQTFDFKDAKGVNNVIFKTDAPLESINSRTEPK